MATVNIIRHKPIAIFCGTAEVVITYDDNQIVRLVEPSGNVGTQYSQELSAQWFGTIQNLDPGLARGGANWGDVYKTDVLWTTPSPDRQGCESYRNTFNAVYGPMIQSVTGCSLKSNRMARFTHTEGFPDPKASFEVQIKAIKGEGLSIGGGKIDFGAWTDFQPSGASVQHTDASGKVVTSLGDDVKREMKFVLVEQYEKKLAAEGVNFKTQTAWLEVLVAIDDNPSVTWQRIEAVREVVAEYFGDHRPAGKIYPVSRIPNLDGIVEPQPRCVTGDVTIDRSGTLVDGFSTWTAIRRKGVSEVLVSGVGGDNAKTILSTIDGHIKSAGGEGLKENGVFNNAYIVAGADSKESRARLVAFNEQFSSYYTGVAPSARTAQYLPGFMQKNYLCGISNRAIYAD
jgi:enamine deaminase RidA (YjgF/YER057c/UK114 family)